MVTQVSLLLAMTISGSNYLLILFAHLDFKNQQNTSLIVTIKLVTSVQTPRAMCIHRTYCDVKQGMY